MPTATAIGAPAWPEPPTAARKEWMFSFQAIAAEYSGGGTAAGDAASRMPRPGSTRPVPNRLSMLSEQATALPSLSSVAKLVEAGRGGSAASCSGADGSSRLSASTPPCRQRAATASARAAATPAVEPRCSAAKAAAAASPPSAGGGRKATLSRRSGSTMAGARRGNAALRSASASGPPASGEASTIRRASAPV